MHTRNEGKKTTKNENNNKKSVFARVLWISFSNEYLGRFQQGCLIAVVYFASAPTPTPTTTKSDQKKNAHLEDCVRVNPFANVCVNSSVKVKIFQLEGVNPLARVSRFLCARSRPSAGRLPAFIRICICLLYLL